MTVFKNGPKCWSFHEITMSPLKILKIFSYTISKIYRSEGRVFPIFSLSYTHCIKYIQHFLPDGTGKAKVEENWLII